MARSLPHGHVAAVHAMAAQAGVPGPARPGGRERDLAYALIVSRVAGAEARSCLRWPGGHDVTLGPDLGVAGASTDGVYAAMDWLHGRQDDIEAQLAGRHLARRAGSRCSTCRPHGWRAACCELAACGLLPGRQAGPASRSSTGCSPTRTGRPVAMRVFAGNIADPAAFIEAVDVVREKFRLEQMVMVGDRGMITSARIRALGELGGLGVDHLPARPGHQKAHGQDDGPLQLSLFDEQDLAEITHQDYPGERLICLPQPAAGRRTRPQTRGPAGRDRDDSWPGSPPGRPPGGSRARTRSACAAGPGGRTSTRWPSTSPSTSPRDRLTWHRNQAAIDAEAALDGIYVIRTPVPASRAGCPAAVTCLQEPGPRRTGLPLHQGRRPGPAPHLPLARGPGPRPRPDLHARLPTSPGTYARPWAPLTYTDEHPPGPRQPRRPRPPLRRTPAPKPPARPAPTASSPAQLPRPARAPGHTHPQRAAISAR